MSSDIEEFRYEIISLIAISFVFVAYHGILIWLINKRPLITTQGQNHQVRKYWVALCIDERKDILAVQTLRNYMMSSSLLATTALTLSTLIAAFFIKGGDDASKLVEMSQSVSNKFTVEQKLFAMIILFTLSFFSYMQSVRISSHAGTMMATSAKDNVPDKPAFLTAHYISSCLFRANMYHTAGTRLFYAAFLTVLWLFGPIISSVASLLLIGLLASSDFVSLKDHK